jgi:hypothetical protein
MFIRLSTENTIDYWEIIKFVALKTIGVKVKSIEEYCRNILIALLSNKYQCWFVLSEDRIIQWVLITGIRHDFGGTISLFAHTLYGFSPISIQEKEQVKYGLIEFAKCLKAQYILCAPSSTLAEKVCEQTGMTQLAKIYVQEVGD